MPINIYSVVHYLKYLTPLPTWQAERYNNWQLASQLFSKSASYDQLINETATT